MRIRSLAIKPDGKQRARERGAREVEGNFLTLEMTQQLINLVYRHVSHNVRARAHVYVYMANLSLSLTSVIDRLNGVSASSQSSSCFV